MLAAQLKTFLRSDFSYDISLIKASEAAYLSDLIRTYLVVLGLSVASYFVYDTWFFVYWFLAFSVARAQWVFVVRRLPDVVGRGLFLVMALSLCLTLAVIVTIIVYCFSRSEADMMALGMMGVILMAISTLSIRVDDLFLCSAYAVFVLGSLAMMPVFRYVHGLEADRLVSLGVMTSLAASSFVLLLRVVRTSRQELRKTREADVARQNLQSLGQLTGGVAHDFNNLLTVINGNLELFDELGGIDCPDRANLLSEVKSASDRAAALTSQLLVYARNSALTPERVDLARVIEAARPLILRLMPATYELRIIAPEMPVWAEVDEKNLVNVLLNLVKNARQAMDGGGEISIYIDSCPRPDSNRLAQTLPEGFYAVVGVRDTGRGIPEHLHHRVMEPYFTTKPVGEGTGLGLSMALGFAEQSGGGLNLMSKPDVGTTVELWFPRADAPVDETRYD